MSSDTKCLIHGNLHSDNFCFCGRAIKSYLEFVGLVRKILDSVEGEMTMHELGGELLKEDMFVKNRDKFDFALNHTEFCSVCANYLVSKNIQDFDDILEARIKKI